MVPGYFFMRDIKRPAQKSEPAEKEINAESGGQRENRESESDSRGHVMSIVQL